MNNFASTYNVPQLKASVHFKFSGAFTFCVIQTEEKKFFSGCAKRHPHEFGDEHTGIRIALKRACTALELEDIWGDDIIKSSIRLFKIAPDKSMYKYLWSYIRKANRKAEQEESNETNSSN